MVAILQNEKFLIINIAIVVVETVTVTTETGRNSRSRKDASVALAGEDHREWLRESRLSCQQNCRRYLRGSVPH